ELRRLARQERPSRRGPGEGDGLVSLEALARATQMWRWPAGTAQARSRLAATWDPPCVESLERPVVYVRCARSWHSPRAIARWILALARRVGSPLHDGPARPGKYSPPRCDRGRAPTRRRNRRG